MENLFVRKSIVNDIPSIQELYIRVAEREGGLARTATEISREYVEHFVARSISYGIGIVAAGKDPGRIIGEIHCYGNGIKTFGHVLGDLTIAVDPEYQGKGVGRLLFTELINEVNTNCPGILRIELIARESNERALRFYESLGFKQEGRLRKRIRSVNGGFEDDIFMAWLRE